MADDSVGIVGGGLIGLAVAREVLRRFPGRRVVVFEKEAEVGLHQTGHNSGVVHAGLYYPAGSLKAKLCTRGRDLLRRYCAERSLPYEACGKLVVAVDPGELPGLASIEERATANGVPGLRRVGPEGIAELEPHAQGVAALHSPATAITDFAAVARALAQDIVEAGGVIRCSQQVTGLRRQAGRMLVRTDDGVVSVRQLVLCAGLQSDRVAGLLGEDAGPRIVPFRGEYLTLVAAKRHLVRGMVYPVPDPRYPFLGVHLTRRVDGEVEVGPNAVLALDREGYGRYGLRGADVRSIARWPGSWRLAGEHWRTGLRELRGSLSIPAYLREAQRYVPAIQPADVVRGRVGVRAQAVERDGSLVDDFRITSGDGVLSLRNAPSPAATSSLAIAEVVVGRLEGRR